MRKTLNILLLLLLTTSLACGSIQQAKLNNNKQAVQMKNIEFIPKEFNDVEIIFRSENSTSAWNITLQRVLI